MAPACCSTLGRQPIAGNALPTTFFCNVPKAQVATEIALCDPLLHFMKLGAHHRPSGTDVNAPVDDDQLVMVFFENPLCVLQAMKVDLGGPSFIYELNPSNGPCSHRLWALVVAPEFLLSLHHLAGCKVSRWFLLVVEELLQLLHQLEGLALLFF